MAAEIDKTVCRRPISVADPYLVTIRLLFGGHLDVDQERRLCVFDDPSHERAVPAASIAGDNGRICSEKT